MSATILLILLAKLAIVIAMLVAAAVDISRRIIPNETVVVVAAGGFLTRVLSPQEPAVWLSIVAALVVLTLMGLAAHRGFLGGGDAKLISAVTLTEPLHDAFPLLLLIALAGGAVAMFYLVLGFARSRRRAVTDQGEVALVKPFDFTASIPYSVSILLGVVSLHVAKVIQCSAANYCWL